MQPGPFTRKRMLALVLATGASIACASTGFPAAASARTADAAAAAPEPQPGAVFTPFHLQLVRAYFAQQYGKLCPAGLVRAKAGCEAPEQAKRYSVGTRLPGDAMLHPVPTELIEQLPRVPPNYRYVRVGEDIVLLAPGGSAVVDIAPGVMRP